MLFLVYKTNAKSFSGIINGTLLWVMGHAEGLSVADWSVAAALWEL